MKSGDRIPIRTRQILPWQPGVITDVGLQFGRGAPEQGQRGISPGNPREGQTYVVQGKASFEGLPLEDGTGVTAYIDGNRVSSTVVNSGQFRLVVPQNPGESFAGKFVELRSTVRGNRVNWPQVPTWQPGGETTVTLEARLDQGSRGPRPGPVRTESTLRDARGLECIRGTVGYLPPSPQEVTEDQRIAINRVCPDARGQLGRLLNPIAVDQADQRCVQKGGRVFAP